MVNTSTKLTGSVGRRHMKRVRTPWKKNDTIKLIKLYEINQHMWDKTSEFYRTKLVRRKTLEEIARALDRDPTDCVKKWNSLRVQLNCELKKRNTAGTHDSMSPQWEHFHQLEFLLPNLNLQHSLPDNGAVEKFPDDSVKSGNSSCNESSTNLEDPSAFCADISLSDPQPFLEESIKIEDDDIQIDHENSEPSILASTTTIQCNEEDKTANRLDEVTKPPNYHCESNRDSCQIFGDFVAEQLRMLVGKERAKLQRAIQRTILFYTTPPEEKALLNSMLLNGES